MDATPARLMIVVAETNPTDRLVDTVPMSLVGLGAGVCGMTVWMMCGVRARVGLTTTPCLIANANGACGCAAAPTIPAGSADGGTAEPMKAADQEGNADIPGNDARGNVGCETTVTEEYVMLAGDVHNPEGGEFEGTADYDVGNAFGLSQLLSESVRHDMRRRGSGGRVC